MHAIAAGYQNLAGLAQEGALLSKIGSLPYKMDAAAQTFETRVIEGHPTIIPRIEAEIKDLPDTLAYKEGRFINGAENVAERVKDLPEDLPKLGKKMARAAKKFPERAEDAITDLKEAYPTWYPRAQREFATATGMFKDGVEALPATGEEVKDRLTGYGQRFHEEFPTAHVRAGEQIKAGALRFHTEFPTLMPAAKEAITDAVEGHKSNWEGRFENYADAFVGKVEDGKDALAGKIEDGKNALASKFDFGKFELPTYPPKFQFTMPNEIQVPKLGVTKEQVTLPSFTVPKVGLTQGTFTVPVPTHMPLPSKLFGKW